MFELLLLGKIVRSIFHQNFTADFTIKLHYEVLGCGGHYICQRDQGYGQGVPPFHRLLESYFLLIWQKRVRLSDLLGGGGGFSSTPGTYLNSTLGFAYFVWLSSLSSNTSVLSRAGSAQKGSRPPRFVEQFLIPILTATCSNKLWIRTLWPSQRHFQMFASQAFWFFPACLAVGTLFLSNLGTRCTNFMWPRAGRGG